MFQRFFSGDNLCSCVQFLLQLRYLYFRFLLRTRINFTCVDGWYKNGGICEHCAVENASCTGPDDYVCWAGYYDENGVCNACGGAMTTIGYGSGADDAGDCGRVLHIGDAQVYLRSNQITTPSLIVQYADNLFYGNMSTTERGNLRIQIGDIVYSVYDDSML